MSNNDWFVSIIRQRRHGKQADLALEIQCFQTVIFHFWYSGRAAIPQLVTAWNYAMGKPECYYFPYRRGRQQFGVKTGDVRYRPFGKTIVSFR